MVSTYLMYSAVFLLSIIPAWLYQKLNHRSVLVGGILLQSKYLTGLFYFLILFAPVFLATIRWGIGVDFWSYFELFKNLQNTDALDVLSESREPLYTLLNYISYAIFPNCEWGIFLISSFIPLMLIVLTLDRFKTKLSLPMGIFIYFMVFYIESFNLVRQSIALAFILYAYWYILEHKPYKYIVFVVIAALFHNTAIICLLFYFLAYRKELLSTQYFVYYSLLFLSIIFIDQLLMLIQFIPIIDFYADRYDISASTEKFGFGFLIETIPVVVPAIIFRKQLIKENPNYLFFINLAFLSIPLRIAGYYLYWIMRLVYYVTEIQYIMIPICLCLIKNRLHKTIAYVITIIFYICYFGYMYVINNRGPGYPYQSIFY